MEWILQNPHASDKLTLTVELACNTPKDVIQANVFANSRRPGKWVKSQEAHDRVAILCGSGPSLRDSYEQIAKLQAASADVWALNGAAQPLWDAGIQPGAQVIMDAQPETAGLVGPAEAHFFASQVDPFLFALEPQAILWHSTYGNELPDEWEGFPARDEGYAIIGGSFSVGCTAIGLLYSLGYRQVKCFGMDSSNQAGKSHVRHQSMNEGEPQTVTIWDGVEYVSSLTMASQAFSFCARGQQWKAAGMQIEVFGEGLLPAMWNKPMAEKDKYSQMWKHDAYRTHSPGAHIVPKFLEIACPYGRVIDFGCGSGKAAVALDQAGLELQVICVDFTENSRDPEALHLPFHCYDLTASMDVRGQFGFCADVMEHIPPSDVDAVISNIMQCVPYCFFQISLVPDVMGDLIGQPLHLSVHPVGWWVDTFTRLGYSLLAFEDQGNSAWFYISR